MSYPMPAFINRQSTPRPVAEALRANYATVVGSTADTWRKVARIIDNPRIAPDDHTEYTAWLLHAAQSTDDWPSAALATIYQAVRPGAIR